MPWLKCLHHNHDTSNYTLSHIEGNSDSLAWKLSQKGHAFPKLLSLCWSSCSFSRQVGKIAIDPMSQNMPTLNTKRIKSNPDLQGSLYKCINSDWFESCTKCLGFDLWPMGGAATLGKIRLDPFPAVSPLWRFRWIWNRFFGVDINDLWNLQICEDNLMWWRDKGCQLEVIY